ncbi:MAG: G1 family endopeptidase [Microbacteriaceae bacterium]|nr:G1 family endopeptidase [Microbacteriaceae bacterium]
MSLVSRLAAGAAVALAAAGAFAAAPAGAAPASAHPSAAGATALTRLAAHGGPGARRLPASGHTVNGAQSSYNWAGYAEQGAFNSASATWTVPTTLTTKSGYASTWVGLDGYADSYLAQTGIEEDVVNKRVTYDAWWEVITPTSLAPEVVYSGFSIKPGDSITGTVTRTGSSAVMTLVDNTTGQSVSHTSAYTGPGASAEWIQEDTDVNGFISTAPDWQKVTFTGAKVNGAPAGLTSSESIDIVDTRGTQETSTSAPNAAKDGFTVTWLAGGTRTRG